MLVEPALPALVAAVAEAARDRTAGADGGAGISTTVAPAAVKFANDAISASRVAVVPNGSWNAEVA